MVFTRFFSNNSSNSLRRTDLCIKQKGSMIMFLSFLAAFSRKSIGTHENCLGRPSSRTYASARVVSPLELKTSANALASSIPPSLPLKQISAFPGYLSSEGTNSSPKKPSVSTRYVLFSLLAIAFVSFPIMLLINFIILQIKSAPADTAVRRAFVYRQKDLTVKCSRTSGAPQAVQGTAKSAFGGFLCLRLLYSNFENV